MLKIVALSILIWTVNCQMGPPPGGMMTECDEVCDYTMMYKADVYTEEDPNYIAVRTSTCPPYGDGTRGWNNPGDACVRHTNYYIPKEPFSSNTPIPVGEEHSEYNSITYLKEDPRPVFGAIGVLVNGVNIFGVGSPCGFGSSCPNEDPNAPSVYVDAVDSEGQTLDECAGHSNPITGYHIHAGFNIDNNTQRTRCSLPNDEDGKHSALLGWMFDGHAIYGMRSLNGIVPDDLDNCSGHTHEINGKEVYHYHLPASYPWIIGCFKSCPYQNNNPMEFNNLVYADGDPYGCEGMLPEAVFVPDAGNGATARATATALAGLVALFMCIMVVM